MAASGGFGTAAWPFGRRLAYWTIGFFGGTGVSILIARGVGRVGLLADRPWTQTVAIAVLNTLFFTIVIWLISRPFYGGEGLSLVGLAPTVFLISLIMTAVHHLAARRPVETHAGPAGAAPARFLERIPPKLRGGALQAVEAEDHYLRLHTDRGSDLILMRLSDAIAELDGIEGAQTHRSWWVAKDAVAAHRRADGRAVLTLRCGVDAPVSRSYVRALRDEGWF